MSEHGETPTADIIASPATGMIETGVRMFGAPFSALSITPSDAHRAPGAIRTALARLKAYDARSGRDLAGCIHDMGDVMVRNLGWEQASDAIEQRMSELRRDDGFVIALGGDHSVSLPLIRGFRADERRVGVIQIDIHHDLRDFHAVPSNGSPFRGLLRDGIINGPDLVQIGIHPFANDGDLTAYATERGVHVITLDEVRSLPMVDLIVRARELLGNCDDLYLSVDIDVLDRATAPGTSAALPGGLDMIRLEQAVACAVEDERLRAMDIVEYNVQHDVADVTALACALTIQHAVAGVMARNAPVRA